VSRLKPFIRLTILAVAVSVGWPVISFGQTILNQVSPVTVAHVQARFIGAFKQGGMSGVVTDVQACYDATTDAKTTQNEDAVAACLLYDYAVVLSDTGWRQAAVARGLSDPGPTSPYLSEQAWTARLAIYVPVPFGDDTAAFGPYFGNAPQQISDAFAASMAN